MISIFLPERLIDLLDQLADQRVGVQQVGGQKQLGFVANLLEEKGHRSGEGVALGQEQHAVEGFILSAVELQLDDLVAVEAR